MVKTSFKQRIGLIILGIILFTVMVEAALRIAGFVYLFSQECRNQLSYNRFNPKQYRILCLGESTTACEGETSYPRQLESVLNHKIPGLEFSVINKGVPGTDTSGILGELEDNLNKYRPQMVITMMGINDDEGLVNNISDRSAISTLKMAVKDLRIYKLLRLIWIRLHKADYLGNMYIERGRDYQSQGGFVEAEETYKKAIALKPDNHVPYVDLAWCYDEQGRVTDAEETFKKAVSIKPRDETIYIELSQFYQQQKRYSEAEAALKKALEVSPDNDTVYISLGWCYGDQGKYLQAEKAFKKAIAIRPNAKIGYTELAQYYYSNKELYPHTEEVAKRIGEYFNKVKAVTGHYNEGTRLNYNRLKNILSHRGIKLVCMQYAMRPLDDLLRNFDSKDGIIFISNEKIFKDALKNGRYEDYFIDQFAGDFGHCTPAGNKLIADNVADILWKECFSKIKK